MKLTFFLSLLTVFQLLATESYSQLTKLTLNLENVKIVDALKEIENQSEFYFLYSPNLIDVERTINIDAEEIPVKDILSNIFNDKVEFAVYDRQVILSPIEQTVQSEQSGLVEFIQQQSQITGTVLDASTGEPLPGVNIIIEGTLIGAVTDVSGNFSIRQPDQNAVLVFSFIGYISQKVIYTGQASIILNLVSDFQALEEVVVVGYGVQRKSVVTGSIASINSTDISNTSVTRPEQALQGKTAGVQVISTSGSPGADMKVRIRGYSSNGTADPLYIVDGVKTSSISGIDPNDISNMEVLKDAASAAIYGAEGGNGVIIITTKKGNSGTGTINYEYQYTMQNVGKLPEMMDATEYATYYNEAGTFNIDLETIDTNTNWLKSVFEPAPVTKHYISFNSGNEKSNFLLSASSLSQDGIIIQDKDKFKRYTFRMNADNQINKWLKVGNNASFASTIRNAIAEDNEIQGIVSSALRMDPLTPIFYEDNAIAPNAQLLIDQGRRLVKDTEGHYFGVSKYISKNPNNPFVSLANTKAVIKNTLLQGSLYAEIVPVKNVVFTSRLGYEFSNSNTSSWTPTYYYNALGYNDVTSVSESLGIAKYWLWENFVNYTNKFGNHSISALAGMSADNRYYKSISASGGPMIVEDPNFAQLNYISSQTRSTVGGQSTLDKKVSYFGRVNYDYMSKYLLVATLRRDGAGSSLLPPANRWGLFPSFSLGWVFTEESFFPNSIIDFGKLRFSWGKNGSLSNLSNYMYSSTITSSKLLYQLADLSYNTVAAPNRLNNPDLRWEASVQTDIGLDLRMFDSKVVLTADYFYKETTDLITPNTPPIESGNTPASINGGNILNKGLELDLEYRNSIGKFNYSIRGNMTHLNNKVTYLNPSIQRILGGASNGAGLNYTAFEQGQPVWYFRGYATDGINETTGEPNYIDKNEDGLINENDKTFIGSPIPDYTYGAAINLSYKGFDFNMNLQGQAGNEVLILWVRNDMPGTNYAQFMFDGRWTASNPTGAVMPKAGFSSNTLLSDLIVYKGDYARIKQMQLGYNLPLSMVSKVKMKSLRVYVSLEDFFTFTKYPGMDPEAGSNNNNSLGMDRGMYPITTKVLFGLSLTL